MDTIHTTNAVEFVDWRAKAKTKLEGENKAFKGSREARAVRDYILKTLIYFATRSRASRRSYATPNARSPSAALLSYLMPEA